MKMWRALLKRLDNRENKALEGHSWFRDYTLCIDHVQRVPADVAGFPARLPDTSFGVSP